METKRIVLIHRGLPSTFCGATVITAAIVWNKTVTEQRTLRENIILSIKCQETKRRKFSSFLLLGRDK